MCRMRFVKYRSKLTELVGMPGYMHNSQRKTKQNAGTIFLELYLHLETIINMENCARAYRC